MLSFAAVHTLAGCLLATDAEADVLGWGRPLTLLLIHDRPLLCAGPTPMREMRSVELPLHPDDVRTDPADLPALLHRLAAGLDHPAIPTPYQVTLGSILGQVRATAPDTRLLAWAACYDGTLTGAGQPARRIDAVDTDGRFYQLTHCPDEDHPLLVVTDTCDPADVPATYLGLVALLDATTAGGSAS
ncbi:hypothetical protein [Micromonospora psammae]|uniref:hypothetical protein n=1 Tax=Micromonospora sp. CPCC 205556 TaxID=3122398 RepID=UPI002FF23B09